MRQFRDAEQRQVLSPDSGSNGGLPALLRPQGHPRARPEAEDQALHGAGIGGEHGSEA